MSVAREIDSGVKVNVTPARVVGHYVYEAQITELTHDDIGL